MVGSLQACVFEAILVGRMTRKNSRDIKNDRSFFIGKRILGSRLMSKGVVPEQYKSASHPFISYARLWQQEGKLTK